MVLFMATTHVLFGAEVERKVATYRLASLRLGTLQLRSDDAYRVGVQGPHNLQKLDDVETRAYRGAGQAPISMRTVYSQ